MKLGELKLIRGCQSHLDQHSLIYTDVLFAKPYLVFKDETIDEAHSTYSNFISFTKKDDMNMTDYNLEFEQFDRKMLEYQIKLPHADLLLNCQTVQL